jgi:glutathione S-transferase
MIDLYALTSPNVQKIFIALEELELPYNTKLVDVWKGDQFSPEFLKINPNGKVPAIVDHDGPGGKPYTVVESGAILLYLADKTGKFLPKDTRKRFDVIQWMMIQMTGVGPMFGQWTHFKLMAPKGNDYSVSRYATEVKRLFDLLEKRGALSRWRRILDRRHRDLPVDPQPRRSGREVGGQPKSGALVQCHLGTSGGQARAREGRENHVQP